MNWVGNQPGFHACLPAGRPGRSPFLIIQRRGSLASPTINESGEAGSLTCEGGFDLPPVWQRSFYYHLVLSEQDFENHFNYIIYNPEKYGYVTNSEDWPYLWFDFEKVDI